MGKIGFVIIDFGENTQGGEIVHGRMLAERLKPFYDVEILTSTRSGVTGHDFPEGESRNKGLIIRRFGNAPVNPEHHRAHLSKTKNARRLRSFLGSLGVLRLISAFYPEWKAGQKADVRYFESQHSYSPALMRYLAEHGSQYQALIFINMHNSSTVLGSMLHPEKSILIPLAHPARSLYTPLFTSLFTRVRYIAFNSAAEQRMCSKIFGSHMARNSVVGVSIEQDSPAEWSVVKEKYGLPENYILYLGRVTKHKINTLIPEFLKYKNLYNSDVTLVLAGGRDNKIFIPDDPGIILTGFVAGPEKTTLIQHAALMVNPSEKESLSLLMLESMLNGIPVLVNGKSDVMRDHCKASGAALYYDNFTDFKRNLNLLLSSPSLRKQMGSKGVEYVSKNYDWDVIIDKLREIIDNI